MNYLYCSILEKNITNHEYDIRNCFLETYGLSEDDKYKLATARLKEYLSGPRKTHNVEMDPLLLALERSMDDAPFKIMLSKNGNHSDKHISKAFALSDAEKQLEYFTGIYNEHYHMVYATKGDLKWFSDGGGDGYKWERIAKNIIELDKNHD